MSSSESWNFLKFSYHKPLHSGIVGAIYSVMHNLQARIPWDFLRFSLSSFCFNFGGPGLDFQLKLSLFCLRLFVVFFSHSGKHLKAGSDCFLPHLSQLIAHSHPLIQCSAVKGFCKCTSRCVLEKSFKLIISGHLRLVTISIKRGKAAPLHSYGGAGGVEEV